MLIVFILVARDYHSYNTTRNTAASSSLSLALCSFKAFILSFILYVYSKDYTLTWWCVYSLYIDEEIRSDRLYDDEFRFSCRRIRLQWSPDWLMRLRGTWEWVRFPISSYIFLLLLLILNQSIDRSIYRFSGQQQYLRF